MGAFESARALCRHIHAGEVFEDGTATVDHLLRVSTMMPDDEITMIVSVLHHALDDTDRWEAAITRRFGVRVQRALKTLTRLPDEPDRPYFWRVGASKDNHAITTLRGCLTDLSLSAGPDERTRWQAGISLLNQAQVAVT